MPEIPLLQPVALRSVVEKFTAPETLTLLNRVPQTPWPFPTVQWEIIRGSRTIAKPNVPNSEAHIVPQLGKSTGNAAFVYLREKKVFSPTTLHWLRSAASSLTDLNKVNASAAVIREIGDLNQRFDNFAEWSLWQALQGRLRYDYEDVQGDVDYQFQASHKPTVATSWATASPGDIIKDVRAMKRLVDRDGRVPAKEAFANQDTIQHIFDAFALRGSANFNAGSLLSDRMRDQYYSTGTLPGFMGLSWGTQDSVFDATGAAYTANPTDPYQESLFLPTGKLILGNFTDGRPVEVMVGPTADDEAPEGYTGKFSKTWKDKDPSARQYLLEWHMLPVVTKPEQIVAATVVF